LRYDSAFAAGHGRHHGARYGIPNTSNGSDWRVLLKRNSLPRCSLFLLLMVFTAIPAGAQSTGSIAGTVVLPDGGPAAEARILLGPAEVTRADQDGNYRFDAVEAGFYRVTGVAGPQTSEFVLVEVVAGQTATANLTLDTRIPIAEFVTNPAGVEESTFGALRSAIAPDTFSLTDQSTLTAADALDGRRGLARRGAGPGSSRPVIRGFSGDRVLLMRDGIEINGMGALAPERSDFIDVTAAERVEVVRSPSTVLYGGSALGGTVNIVERPIPAAAPRQGLHGRVGSVIGSRNGLAGASTSLEYGHGNWSYRFGGGGKRTGDYSTPAGTVINSGTRSSRASVGVGWFVGGGYATVDYDFDEGRYGVPTAADATGSLEIDGDRNDVRFRGGVRIPNSLITGVDAAISFSRANYDNIGTDEDGVTALSSSYDSRVFSYRGTFTHRRFGALTGQFGMMASHRRIRATGEPVTTPVEEDTAAAFILEEVNLEHLRLEFGGRIEGTGYVTRRTGTPSNQSGHFSGASGTFGAEVDLWGGGVFAVNGTSSFRPPAVNELFNAGVNPVTLLFEVGSTSLTPERGNSVDFSLRHWKNGLRGELNVFYYDFNGFIYPVLSGSSDVGIEVLQYAQSDAEIRGAEIALGFRVMPRLWVETGVEVVDTTLRATGNTAPFTPPVRGRFGLDYNFRNLHMRPHVIVADGRDDVAASETGTPGYSVFNVDATYAIPRPDLTHVLTFRAFNLGNRLYRNHLDLIKDRFGELGRGVRLSYAMEF